MIISRLQRPLFPLDAQHCLNCSCVRTKIVQSFFLIVIEDGDFLTHPHITALGADMRQILTEAKQRLSSLFTAR